MFINFDSVTLFGRLITPTERLTKSDLTAIYGIRWDIENITGLYVQKIAIGTEFQTPKCIITGTMVSKHYLSRSLCEERPNCLTII